MLTKKLFYQFLVKSIPLTVYLQSITAVVITKGVAEIRNPDNIVFGLYYTFLATIYLVQIIRVLLTHFLSGYSRGKWIYITNLIQFIIQTILVLSVLIYQNMGQYWTWIIQELVIFLLAWGSTMTIRLFFLLLIAMKILRKGKNNRKLKQSYWLTITTKQQLYQKKGQLCYFQYQWEYEKQIQKSLIYSDNQNN